MKESLETNHLDVANNLNKLALLYKGQGKYEEAESVFLQALELRKKRLREDHLDIASNLNHLALLYKAQKRYKEAESFFLQALTIFKNQLGEDHPDTKILEQNYVLIKYQNQST